MTKYIISTKNEECLPFGKLRSHNKTSLKPVIILRFNYTIVAEALQNLGNITVFLITD